MSLPTWRTITLPSLLATCECVGSVAHQCGISRLDDVRSRYVSLGIDADVQPFFGDLPDRLNQDVVVIARAGASTLSELAATGSPAILVPLARSVRDHQRENAAIAARFGASVLEEETLAATLGPALQPLLDNARLRTWRGRQMTRLMPDDAADRCVDYLARDVAHARIRRAA